MGRTAIVTGGTRGLGRAIALALKQDGHRVAAVYHGNDEAAARFSEASAVAAYKWDVSDFDACRDGVARVERDLGPVEILVNNAGIVRDATLHKMTPEQWRSVVDTNLGSVFNMCRNVIEGMRKRGYGRIVNVSSVNGQKGQFGQVNYSASKAGMLGFTRALALEAAHSHITVNAIAPGYCDTEMMAAVPEDVLKSIVATIPIGRLGRPEDVARVAAFLAGEDAGFITGATLAVNGGQYMS
ncbi:MAG TPA: acetoacetyl-CoA reductase [Burkholderiaceae bacterium]